jgi:hypothetical protein
MVLPQIGSSWAMHSQLGASPKSNKCKTSWLDEEIKCSSRESKFLSPRTLLSTQTLARFEARSKKEKRREHGMLGRCFV